MGRIITYLYDNLVRFFDRHNHARIKAYRVFLEGYQCSRFYVKRLRILWMMSTRGPLNTFLVFYFLIWFDFLMITQSSLCGCRAKPRPILAQYYLDYLLL